MVLIFQWICFWLISDSDSVYGSTHAVIGNYTQLNPKDCGISYLSIGFSNICYKWHKNPLSLLTEGRDPLKYEVPWFVTITLQSHFLCGGSLIANQWIITARHCLLRNNNPDDYQIYFGTGPIYAHTLPHNVSELHLWPDNSNDLALIKLASRVDSSLFGFPVYSICLPAPHIIPKEPEYALTIGRGPQGSLGKTSKIGYRKIITNHTGIPFEPQINPEFEYRNVSNMLFTMPADKQALICRGDSGGPLWQFNSGRAVLIGVLSNAGLADNKCNAFHNISTEVSGFVRVSQFIDWIKDITNFN